MIPALVKIREHVCGFDYCIVLVETDNYKTSFSFSVVYLFQFVKEEDRPWFIEETVKNYINTELMSTRQPMPSLETYSITNIKDVLQELEELYKKGFITAVRE